MKRILLAGALALAATGQVLAADLPPPAPAPPPPRAPAAYVPTIVPAYSWAGIYIGINGGYSFGTVTPSAASGGSSFSDNGFLVGGTIGGNLQAGAFVFGVEGDFGYSSVKATLPVNDCAAGATCQFTSDWLGTARGRVGVAADRVLFFVTGGGAFAPAQFAQTGAASVSTTMTGWTGGAGVEVAFAQNWTAKVEYLYIDFPNPSVTFAGGGTLSFKDTQSLVRLGVNYKF